MEKVGERGAKGNVGNDVGLECSDEEDVHSKSPRHEDSGRWMHEGSMRITRLVT